MIQHAATQIQDTNYQENITQNNQSRKGHTPKSNEETLPTLLSPVRQHQDTSITQNI
jgi:hypothetical protein